MKKQLEEKIINKIYRYETKKTSLKILLEGVVLFLLLVSVILFSIVFVRIIAEQQTVELLHLFEENGEVIRQYLWNTIQTLYYEIPKALLLFIILGISGMIILSLYIVKNYRRAIRRIKLLIKYWLSG